MVVLVAFCYYFWTSRVFIVGSWLWFWSEEVSSGGGEEVLVCENVRVEKTNEAWKIESSAFRFYSGN
ncbi:hypothetical protein IC575_028437 [Cucumis melo]